MSRRRELIVAGALLALGLTQMTAYLANATAVRAIAAATNASPAPKVFSAVSGLETYSTAFYVDWTDADGVRHSRQITSEMYDRLPGPYNRRNVYGAVLAFGPVMASNPATAPMFQAVMRASLCGERRVLHGARLRSRPHVVDPDPTRAAAPRGAGRDAAHVRARLPMTRAERFLPRRSNGPEPATGASG